MASDYVIITGASQGIGESCAQTFLNHGYSPINISRHDSNIPKIQNIKFDLSQKLDEKKLDQDCKMIPKNSRICLIHNAFPYYHDNHTNFDAEQFNKSVNIVINNTILLNKYFLNKMGVGSSIIFIGSTLSSKAADDCLSYVILKHAQVGLMRALSMDLGEQEIHTCCICPGFTDTQMLRSHLQDNQIQSIVKNIVLKNRLILPQEIADFVYSCSRNPITNGEVYHVNLGQR